MTRYTVYSLVFFNIETDKLCCVASLGVTQDIYTDLTKNQAL